MFLKIGASLLIGLIWVNTTIGQNKLETFSCPVSWYGRTLDFPFLGGLNAPQFGEPDLNNDGLPDLVVFDRAGNTILPFLRQADGNDWKWVPAREYAPYFPNYTHWGLYRDYDGDGIMDLFSFSLTSKPGFRAYRGRYINDTLTFDIYPVWGTEDNIMQFVLPNGSKTQIYIAFDDIPAFDDVDGDGDLDLVTFDPGGGNAYFFRNHSIELGFGKDSLHFIQAEVCWGKFYESGVTEAISLSPAPDECQKSLKEGEVEAGLRHAGSTLLTMDMNGDGLKDLFLGDISFSNITLLTNGGTPFNAWMVAQDTFWPKHDIPVHIPYFPAAFAVDWDLDGATDILVAPNNYYGSLDTGNVWFYRNEGTDLLPDHKLLARDLLVNQMLDAGTGSRPAFIDIDGDGLLDMLIGNHGIYSEGVGFIPSLIYLRNTGTANSPSFTLENMDFQGMSAFGQNFVFAFTPAAGDLDGDGDMDLIVGHASGTLYYLENTAGPGQPAQFEAPVSNYMNLTPGAFASPQIVDVNGDGLMDLLVGVNVGRILYYQNIGTPGSPAFNTNASVSPNTDFYGQIDMRTKTTFAGQAAPWLYKTENGLEMVVGSNAGPVRRYAVNALDGTAKFPVLDSLYTGYIDGFESKPVMADLDNDGFYEIIIGTLRGGLTAYHTEKAVVTAINTVVQKPLGFAANAIPGEKTIRLHLFESEATDCHVSIYDLQGKRHWQGLIPWGETVISSSHFPASIYLVHAWQGSASYSIKLFVP